jgi:parallel beta-helix repeat protein
VSVSTGAIAILVWLALPAVIAAATLHVGPSPHPYSTISSAEAAASPNDTIVVHDMGTDPDYEENVDVDVDHLIIKAADGEDVSVKAADSTDNTIEVIADYVTIDGFTVYGATGSGKAGICVTGNDRAFCTVSDNVCGSDDTHSNYIGIFLKGVYYHKISHCVVTGNVCNWNAQHGIQVANSIYVTASDNVCNSSLNGIMVGSYAYFNTFVGNTCTSNDKGIRTGYSQNNIFYLNDLSDNNENVYGGTGGNWNSPSALYYSYASMHKNFLGNWYDDYDTTGQDLDGDGVGADPYDLDTYPLMLGSDHYGLQAWWLDENDEMFVDDQGQDPGSVPIGGERGFHVWYSGEPAAGDLNFPGDVGQTWTGQIVFTVAPDSGETFTIEPGIWDGASFTPGGPVATVTADGDYRAFAFETDNVPFTVPGGCHVAVRVTNLSLNDHSVLTGGAWSYLTCPEGSSPIGVKEFSRTPGQTLDLLSRNAPNPFSSRTTIHYEMPRAAHVTLEIYDLTGRLVRTLVDEHKQAGSHSSSWAGENFRGQEVRSGVYFYRVQIGSFQSQDRMLLLR